VSSLCSDEYTDRSPVDKPLHVSELTKEMPGGKRHGELHGALRELKDLENKHCRHHVSHGGQPQHNDYGFKGKENQPVTESGHPSNSQHGNIPFSAYGPPLLHYDQTNNQPFGRLMSILKQFNNEVMGGTPRSSDGQGSQHLSGGHPQLLSVKPQGNDHGVCFPPIMPTQAWADNKAPENVNRFNGPMPLLKQDMQYVPMKHDLPEKDLPGTSPYNYGYMGMFNKDIGHVPLLRATWDSKPFPQMRDTYGVPMLIPPHEIIDYEQRKYHKQAYKKKQLQEKIDQKLREVSGKKDVPLGVKLLRADLETFSEKDERDNEAR
jgi:hypothetical protein